MESHVSIIGSAISALLLLLLSVISWFLRDKVKDNEVRMTRLEDRTQEIEVANAKRDAEMSQLATGLSQIGEMRAELAIRYVSREEMAKFDSKLDKIYAEITSIKISQAAERPGRPRGARGENA